MLSVKFVTSKSTFFAKIYFLITKLVRDEEFAKLKKNARFVDNGIGYGRLA